MFEANPTIRRIERDERSLAGALTYNGVIHRTGFLLLLTGVAFGLVWRGLQAQELSPMVGIGSSILGLVLALIIIFTRATNPLLISAYALCQGAALGTVSYFAHQKYPGIALQAVAGTLGCFLVVMALYSIRVLRATPLFVKVITGALLGIMVLYLADLVAGFFGHPLGVLQGSSGLSIGISAFVVLIGALSFVIDFAAIEHAVGDGVDAKYGWHFAFSLLVGLVFLYFEILRLLSKLRGRD